MSGCMRSTVAAGAVAVVLLAVNFSRPEQAQPASDAARFDVVSIKVDPTATSGAWSNHLNRGRWVARDAPVAFVVQTALGVGKDQIVGLPDWAMSTVVMIDARAPEDTPDALLQPMLRNMLADRFQMVWHTETRSLAGRELVIAKGGPKLQTASAPCVNLDASQPLPQGQHRCGTVERAAQRLTQIEAGTAQIQTTFTGYSVSMTELAAFIDSPMASAGTPVVDDTGLTGIYDFTFTFPETMHIVSRGEAPPPANTEPVVTFADMLKSACGLELKPAKVPVPVYVIDKLEPPTPN